VRCAFDGRAQVHDARRRSSEDDSQQALEGIRQHHVLTVGGSTVHGSLQRARHLAGDAQSVFADAAHVVPTGAQRLQMRPMVPLVAPDADRRLCSVEKRDVLDELGDQMGPQASQLHLRQATTRGGVEIQLILVLRAVTQEPALVATASVERGRLRHDRRDPLAPQQVKEPGQEATLLQKLDLHVPEVSPAPGRKRRQDQLAGVFARPLLGEDRHEHLGAVRQIEGRAVAVVESDDAAPFHPIW
jgi:hypothetical protein